MRSLLVVAVACFCLGGAAMAQTDSGVGCLDLGDLAGKPAKVLWAHSFSAFLDAHGSELSNEQAEVIQQAIDYGSSRRFSLKDTLSRHTIKGLLDTARQLLTRDQFSEILAGMGPQAQFELLEAGTVDDIACSCKVGAGTGCPPDFPCTVGCHTWGTGEWNGICVRKTTTTGQ